MVVVDNSGRHCHHHPLLIATSGGFLSARETVYAPGAATFEVFYKGALPEFVKALSSLNLQQTQLRIAETSSSLVRLEAK